MSYRLFFVFAIMVTSFSTEASSHISLTSTAIVSDLLNFTMPKPKNWEIEQKDYENVMFVSSKGFYSLAVSDEPENMGKLSLDQVMQFQAVRLKEKFKELTNLEVFDFKVSKYLGKGIRFEIPGKRKMSYMAARPKEKILFWITYASKTDDFADYEKECTKLTNSISFKK